MTVELEVSKEVKSNSISANFKVTSWEQGELTSKKSPEIIETYL